MNGEKKLLITFIGFSLILLSLSFSWALFSNTSIGTMTSSISANSLKLR